VESYVVATVQGAAKSLQVALMVRKPLQLQDDRGQVIIYLKSRASLARLQNPLRNKHLCYLQK
jgi:hypothetical protein